jgi:hypothetical protein
LTPVAFGDLVLHGHVDIRKCRPAPGHHLLEGVARDGSLVQEHGRREDLVDDLGLLLVPDLLEETNRRAIALCWSTVMVWASSCDG